MKPGSSPLKRASACFGALVDVALRQEERFGGLAELRAQRAAVHQAGLGPVAVSLSRWSCCALRRANTANKKPGRAKVPAGFIAVPGLLATCLTWLQAGRLK